MSTVSYTVADAGRQERPFLDQIPGVPQDEPETYLDENELNPDWDEAFYDEWDDLAEFDDDIEIDGEDEEDPSSWG